MFECPLVEWIRGPCVVVQEPGASAGVCVCVTGSVLGLWSNYQRKLLGPGSGYRQALMLALSLSISPCISQSLSSHIAVKGSICLISCISIVIKLWKGLCLNCLWPWSPNRPISDQETGVSALPPSWSMWDEPSLISILCFKIALDKCNSRETGLCLLCYR